MATFETHAQRTFSFGKRNSWYELTNGPLQKGFDLYIPYQPRACSGFPIIIIKKILKNDVLCVCVCVCQITSILNARIPLIKLIIFVNNLFASIFKASFV